MSGTDCDVQPRQQVVQPPAWCKSSRGQTSPHQLLAFLTQEGDEVSEMIRQLTPRVERNTLAAIGAGEIGGSQHLQIQGVRITRGQKIDCWLESEVVDRGLKELHRPFRRTGLRLCISLHIRLGEALGESAEDGL